MAYIWSKALETGDHQLDDQHQEMFRKVNSLLDACSKGEGQTEIVEILDFLNEYVQFHLEDEELLMQKSGYSFYDVHKHEHDLFSKLVHSIINEYETNGASLILLAKISSMTTTYLMCHMKKEDLRMAAHIRSYASKSLTS